MSDVTTTYVGVIDGLHTWEVRSASGELVGINQSVCPGDGWTLDEATGEWSPPA